MARRGKPSRALSSGIKGDCPEDHGEILPRARACTDHARPPTGLSNGILGRPNPCTPAVFLAAAPRGFPRPRRRPRLHPVPGDGGQVSRCPPPRGVSALRPSKAGGFLPKRYRLPHGLRPGIPADRKPRSRALCHIAGSRIGGAEVWCAGRILRNRQGDFTRPPTATPQPRKHPTRARTLIESVLRFRLIGGLPGNPSPSKSPRRSGRLPMQRASRRGDPRWGWRARRHRSVKMLRVSKV